MNIDPWILAFSAVTVIATVWMGFWSARRSKTASDFFVAGRRVSVGWNASAISGEYLSAASFMGVAGMVMSSGYDALWYPVCYACGYLFLLLFIAGPLRRFGAYTIPDFAEGRFDSPVFRKIAVVFVLFIGFFYTMPQMKGAGTTLAYIFPGLPYWAGVVLVGAVITLNVALGGMKGITLVQAFQYWAKMFAISVPIFVLMAVYGNYGKQVEENAPRPSADFPVTANLSAEPRQFRKTISIFEAADEYARLTGRTLLYSGSPQLDRLDRALSSRLSKWGLVKGPRLPVIRLEFEPERTITNSSREFSDTTQLSLAPSARSPGMRVTVMGPGRSDVTKGIASLEASVVVVSPQERVVDIWRKLQLNNVELVSVGERYLQAAVRQPNVARTLPAKAPADSTWLNPFGPLTTKAAKAAKPSVTYSGKLVSRTHQTANLNASLEFMKGRFDSGPINMDAGTFTADYVFLKYVQFRLLSEKFDIDTTAVSQWSPGLEKQSIGWAGILDGSLESVSDMLSTILSTNGVTVLRKGNHFTAFPTKDAVVTPVDLRPYALLYTYSLIIALVCGTAGLPHILVRFYTNPDGVAAKRTTMWVMILIGVFYIFPPVFGVMGRNLMPQLYNGLSGVKGTDGVVLRLPTILNQKAERDVPRRGEGSEDKTMSSSPPSQPSPPSRDTSSSRETGLPWGSILSGITCAGAFAAFMSTFSGLLVSMTGAMAHDVYGRILRPKSTPEQRLRAFKIAAVLIGGIAIVLGCFVEPLEINFMVGQAFAIAAASYFPLLFMSVWWRGMTTRGAATGMLAGGLCALASVALTNVSNLALDKGPMGRIFAGFAPLNEFWAAHPLWRILCEQPAIWTVPLAIALMIVVSKLTRQAVPPDVRKKMLVLHAPEKLGLKQEYIQEHQQGH